MKRILTVFLMLLGSSPLFSLTLWGVDINGVEVQTGLLLVKNSVGDSAPDPLCNTLGISVPFKFMTNYTFRPEVQFFAITYGFENQRAVPLESMFDSVSILTILINPNFGYEYPLNNFISFTGEAGLGFMIRTPIYFNGKTGGDMAIPVTGWLMAGRFIYPNLSVGMHWQFSPLFALVIREQNFFPIFNLWDSKTVWWDEFGAEVNVGLRFTF